MSIDRIGPARPPITSNTAATGTTGASQTQSTGVDATKSASTTASQAPQELSPAEQVRQGQLDLQTYLDAHVQKATSHLEGKLGEADLNRIRDFLREQLLTDPALQELVQRATGQLPSSQESE